MGQRAPDISTKVELLELLWGHCGDARPCLPLKEPLPQANSAGCSPVTQGGTREDLAQGPWSSSEVPWALAFHVT